MPQLIEFRADVERFAEGSFTARLVPFGEPAPMGDGTVEFKRGSLRSASMVPLTVDHSDKVLDRIGVMTSFVESDDGAYGSFQLSDTEAGRTVRQLLLDGAVTDVSVGVMVDSMEDGTMFGKLEHVSLVDRGRFATDKIENPSKVLSVHSTKEPTVADETVEAAAPVVAQFDDSEIRSELVTLHDTIEEVRSEMPAKTSDFSAMDVFVGLVEKRITGTIVNHQLADVISDVLPGAGAIAPDVYWGAGLQMKMDRRRPLYATAGSAPFPATGNVLELPRQSQATLVGPRGAEKSIIPSRAWEATLETFTAQWFAGGVDVSLEIISQSDPGVLGVVMNSLLNQYAQATEAAATTDVEAAAIVTGAGLDTSTYAALVADIITTSDLIEDGTGAPGNILGVTPAQWIAILSLMDGGDRRQFATVGPSNADGSGSLTTRGIDVGGVFIYRAPQASVAVQYNTDSFKNGEKSPMTIAADNVELMGRDVGILGATIQVFWPVGVYKYSV